MCIWPQVVAEDMPVFVLDHRIARYSGRSTYMFLDEFAVDKALICIIVIPLIVLIRNLFLLLKFLPRRFKFIDRPCQLQFLSLIHI